MVVKMRDRDLIFDYLDKPFYRCHIITLNKSVTFSRMAQKQKKTNSKSEYEGYFKYPVTVALRHKEIANHPERVDNILPFTKKMENN